MAGELRILDVEEVKTEPYAPRPHPFVERLIGTIRRECVDRTLFWTAADLERKLVEFQDYYNAHRAHAALNGRPPASPSTEGVPRASLTAFQRLPLVWPMNGNHDGPVSPDVGR